MNFAVYTFIMAPRGPNSTIINMGMMFAMVAIFWVLLIRPNMKERERHEMMLSSVKKGDDIVTTGGIIGKVVHAEETQLTVRTGENTRITVDRARIAAVLDHKGEPQEE